MWENRIVSYSAEDPKSLTANPHNFRRHPKGQRLALNAMIADVGMVQPVIVNANTGRIIDGHLRVDLAIEQGQSSMPVIWVDVSADEEMKILATLDPIGNMATTDAGILDALIGQLTPPDKIIADVWETLLASNTALVEETIKQQRHAVEGRFDHSAQERYLNSSYRTLLLMFDLVVFEEVQKKLVDLAKASGAASNQDVVLELIRKEHAHAINHN